ncbi:MAG: isopenicillin-N epimerase [Saprospiraceae bacterium]|nr:MAG: isopenicillin-N epimerase [Saprospiraceae bacterium]
MSTNRRNFLRKLTTTLLGAGTIPFFETLQGRHLLQVLQEVASVPCEQLVTDEVFWRQVRLAYTVSSGIINLNNGGVSPQPKVVQEAVERYNQLSNETPTYYMWRILTQGKEPIRRRLAALAGCDAEEIAINRNTSEALETVIFGLRLQAGDEVVLTKQDYPNMINAWKQRAKREGIVLKWLSFDFPIEDNQLIVDQFTQAFSSKTKVVHLTHIINWCGQLLPVKEIAEIAHSKGIQVVVDGAHSFAHLDFKIPDLNCDYFGTSLHKWLCAPFGSGMLYVRKSRIKNLYPLFAGDDPESEDIRKFENLGTRSLAIEQAIGQAIEFHLMIGPERKEARLKYLRNYILEQIKDIPGVMINTPLQPENSCAIALVDFQGIPAKEVASELFRNYKIHVVGIDWENLQGLRITPNVYTLTEELDVLVKALKEIWKKSTIGD